MAITNNLNFGNPRRPEVYYQLRESIRGMAEACEALGTPVTGGNVSLYNESPLSAVYPTPVIGMVGLIEHTAHITRAGFEDEGHTIVLLGEPSAHIGASEYLARIHGVVAGSPPPLALIAERALIDALLDAIAAGLVHSAHDCSDGGLAVALAECCIMNRELERGATVDLSSWSALPERSLLFGEAQGRVIVTTTMPDTLLRVAGDHEVPARVIGQVGAIGAPLQITTSRSRVVAPLARLDEAYYEAIPRLMSQPATAASSPDHA